MKRIIIIVIWSLGAVGMLVLLGFINRENDSVVCWNLAVEVDNSEGNYFVDEDIIRNTVYDLGDSIVGTLMTDISIHRLRNAILQHEAVKTVELTKTIDGQVKIKVGQRNPIARILLADAPGYYIDSEGLPMPLSNKFTAHLLVFTGHVKAYDDIDELEAVKQMFELADFIRKNEFWSAQAEHFHVNEIGEFEMIPRVGNHRILLGEATELTMKFKKLKTFYAEILASGDLNLFTKIDLRFRDQVVCTKKPW